MNSPESIPAVADATAKPNPAREERYTPPKLEKMQQLAQVTGTAAVTGAPV